MVDQFVLKHVVMATTMENLLVMMETPILVTVAAQHAQLKQVMLALVDQQQLLIPVQKFVVMEEDMTVTPLLLIVMMEIQTVGMDAPQLAQ